MVMRMIISIKFFDGDDVDDEDNNNDGNDNIVDDDTSFDRAYHCYMTSSIQMMFLQHME